MRNRWTYEQLCDAWTLCMTFAKRAIRDKREPSWEFDWRRTFTYYKGAAEAINEIIRNTPIFT